ncbi:uncharacterized protein MELLADRAFT_91870 [Melampsora larici-populina 98AG31]|uniref:Alpha-type protein kinase domain-containing protein n=1 Tax=Melampsora larici-populina (strain 98AG31 / pathotype 3-4-7) TaxID=747676 RepID=F4S0N2_MELLP|nr:uncharacterized protein MELLADRAFT_91870 [Melampsora larici-populina 98AG31]EGG01837.1 hypothetical protein MELLADRAFT_91870 [Melampsora larici-populina 98AG31]
MIDTQCYRSRNPSDPSPAIAVPLHNYVPLRPRPRSLSSPPRSLSSHVATMKSAQYIDSSFHRLNPGRPLPLPQLHHSTGLACPACYAQGRQDMPLKYIRQLSTYWRVACSIQPPPGGQGHFYRSWTFAKLNHEIASINAGHWPPIPYTPPSQPVATQNPTASNSDIGPPQQLTMFASQQLVEQLFPTTAPTSKARPPKQTDGILCRGVGGRTSAHKPTDARKGNKQCHYHACASCCQKLGDKNRACPAKGHAHKTNTTKPHASTSAAPAIHPVLKRLNRESSVEVIEGSRQAANLPMHRRLPNQSAQTGACLAQEMDNAQLGRFFELHSERLEANKRDQRLEADEAKVVKVVAWLRAEEAPKFFSFLASKWPKFTLDQCQHLVNEAAVIEGLEDPDGWSRTFSIWDPTLDGWVRGSVYTMSFHDMLILTPNVFQCTQGVDVPSRHPIAPRQILVKRVPLKEKECLRFDYFLKSTYKTTTSPRPPTPYLPSGVSSTSPVKAPAAPTSSQPGLHDPDDDDEVEVIPNIPASSVNQDPAQAQPDSDHTAKASWPDDDAPMSHLMEWHMLLSTMPRLRAWDAMFKHQFVRGDRTVYRYAQWLDLVTEPRLRRWEALQNSINCTPTIGALRQEFHKEFVEVGRLAGANIGANATSQASLQEPLQRGQKRKLVYSTGICALIRSHCSSSTMVPSPTLTICMARLLGMNGLSEHVHARLVHLARDERIRDSLILEVIRSDSLLLEVIRIEAIMVGEGEECQSLLLTAMNDTENHFSDSDDSASSTNTQVEDEHVQLQLPVTSDPISSNLELSGNLDDEAEAESPSASEATTFGLIDPASITLHSVCGMENVVLVHAFNPTLVSQHLGRYTLPLVQLVQTNLSMGNPHNNATIFCIQHAPSNGIGWTFCGQPALITISNEFIHAWDFRSTYKGTLSKGNLSIPLGIRVFHQNDRALSVYQGIAQTNLHVAVSLERFREDVGDVMTTGNSSDCEWETLQMLRFQENVIGELHYQALVHSAHHNLSAFTAEELVEGPREMYSLDSAFYPITRPPNHHYRSTSIRKLLNAFSHWSYNESGGSSVIAGFQGVGPVITEAVVHDVTGHWTIGNFGQCAIRRFPDEHTCNNFCVALDLQFEDSS